MIESAAELMELFEKEKDNTSRAAKRLSTINEILSSAYRLDGELANQMWSYIIELNVASDVTRAKFFVAQVFKKLVDILGVEDSAAFLSMDPDRIKLLSLYGYDGRDFWRCLDAIIRGSIANDQPDDAICAIECSLEKHGGEMSPRGGGCKVAWEAARICCELIDWSAPSGPALVVLQRLLTSENADVSTIAEICQTVSAEGFCEDFDMLFFVASKCREPELFFQLIWDSRNQFEKTELCQKWEEYYRGCADGEFAPYGSIHEDDDCTYGESKRCLYTTVLNMSDELLGYYFTQKEMYDLAAAMVEEWIFASEWQRLSEYVSMFLNSRDVEGRDFRLDNVFNEFENACFYEDWRDSHDRFGRSYKSHMKTCSHDFATAMVSIDSRTVGSIRHESFHSRTVQFVQKLEGSLDLLSDAGFEDAPEKRTAFQRLVDFAKGFPNADSSFCYPDTVDHQLIMESFTDEGVYLRGSSKESDECCYRLACNDDVAKLYCKYCFEYDMKARLMSACIRNGDVDRALELVEFMAETASYDDYAKPNGWGSRIRLSATLLTREFRDESSRIYRREPCFAEEREQVAAVVEKIVCILPESEAVEARKHLLLLKNDQASNDTYVQNLLDTVELYTTFPKPRGKGGARFANAASSDIRDCFKALSDMGRTDVIVLVLHKLAQVKDKLKTISYSRWVCSMLREVSAGVGIDVLESHPELLDHFVDDPYLFDNSVILAGRQIGKFSNWSLFSRFRSLVFARQGYVKGFDYLFKPDATSAEPQQFVGENGAIVYINSVDVSADIELNDSVEIASVDVSLSFPYAEKASKRIIVSNVTVNDKKVDESGFCFVGWDFDWLVKNRNGEIARDLTVYSDFFKNNGICSIERISFDIGFEAENGDASSLAKGISLLYSVESGRFELKQ